jgi:hypothetical protein
MIKYTFLFIACCIAFVSCTDYEEMIIPGNAPPPDHTIQTNIYEDYVNKSFILAAGHEPSAAELDSFAGLLRQQLFAQPARQAFADYLFSLQDYSSHVYEENRFALLRTTDSAEVAFQIVLLNNLLLDSTYLFYWPVIQYETARLQLLLDARPAFLAGTIDIAEVQRRMVNNYFYDQINMGSQNFVLAVFQQLVNRQPTQSELASGVAMVDGANSILFLQSGSSKSDFLDIVLNSDNYLEGQVVQLFSKYLLRPPGSVEMADFTTLYRTTGSYTEVQKALVTTDEFIGIR